MKRNHNTRLAALEAVSAGEPVYLVHYEDELTVYVLPGEGQVSRERWHAEQRRLGRRVCEIRVQYDQEGHDALP